MKNLFFLIAFFPFASFGQCATWSTADSTMALKPVVEKYLQFQMVETGDTSRHDRFAFGRDDSFAYLGFSLATNKTLEGSEVKTSYGAVKSILISGPAERIDSLFNDYFLPLIQPCSTKKSDTWIMWKGFTLIHIRSGEHNGIPMAYIRIEKSM